MAVINILKNGTTCEDMSKVAVPKATVEEVVAIAKRERKEK